MLTAVYLRIARQHLNSMKNNPKDMFISTVHESQHIRDALVCIVFSAFAVEYAITELIWTRIALQTPAKYRRMMIGPLVKNMRSINDRIEFLREATKMSDTLLSDIKRLFDYRNEIAHCRPEFYEGSVQVLRSDKNGKTVSVAENREILRFAGATFAYVYVAEWCYETAKRAVRALREEVNAPEWRPQGDTAS